MAGEGTIIPINTKPGIQRDGTMFDSDACVDGQWTRWIGGKPRKMGGYRQMSASFSGPMRQIYLRPLGPQFAIFSGSSNKLEVGYFTNSGVGAGINNVTPAGFATSIQNMWQIDGMYDPTGANAPLIFAIATPSLTDAEEETDAIIYFSQADSIAAFDVLTNAPNVSGGIVVLHPYLFAYGNNGYVAWCDTGNPTEWAMGDAGDAHITENKILRGVPFTGGVAASPGGLFWSLDKLMRASYVGGSNVFQFDFVGEASLLGADAYVEYNGLYYWAEHDRFCFYNGTIIEMENTMNMDFFFESINQNQHQKVVGFKIQRFGEIGWMFCTGQNTEPDHAIIYNIRGNFWYDTPLPEGGRSAVISTSTFNYPIWAGLPTASDTIYPLWQQEFGFDKIVGSNTEAIQSFFETSMFSQPGGGWPGQNGQTKDQQTLVFRFEPDFQQNGNMTVAVIARSTPQGNDFNIVDPTTFTSTTEFLDFGQYDGRLVRLRIESNVQGGQYKMGNPLLHIKAGGGRIGAGAAP